MSIIYFVETLKSPLSRSIVYNHLSMKIFNKLKLFFVKKRKNNSAFYKEVKVKKMSGSLTKPKTKKTKGKRRNIPSQVKIVVTGSVGAGKTTAIKNISEVDPITTESVPTDQVADFKASTTTSMDYGSFNHKLKSKINIYGTPGQKRFSFMSPILTKGASGLIILINNNQEKPLTDLAFYLKTNEEFLKNNPAIIGITHCDKNKKNALKKYILFTKRQGLKWPVVSIDARRTKDVHLIVNLLLTYLANSTN